MDSLDQRYKSSLCGCWREPQHVLLQVSYYKNNSRNDHAGEKFVFFICVGAGVVKILDRCSYAYFIVLQNNLSAWVMCGMTIVTCLNQYIWLFLCDYSVMKNRNNLNEWQVSFKYNCSMDNDTSVIHWNAIMETATKLYRSICIARFMYFSFSFLLRGLGGFFIRRKIDNGVGRRDLVYRSLLHSVRHLIWYF